MSELILRLSLFIAISAAHLNFGVASAEELISFSVGKNTHKLELPPNYCDASDTAWGNWYSKFLLDLGQGAGGDPKVLLVLSDCEFTSGTSANLSPSSWGYLAYDNQLPQYWFGQRNLNKRLRNALQESSAEFADFEQAMELTRHRLQVLSKGLRFGEVRPTGEYQESAAGFLSSALTNVETETQKQEVYLSAVSFLRSRRIVTLTIYMPTDNLTALNQMKKSVTSFLTSLEN